MNAQINDVAQLQRRQEFFAAHNLIERLAQQGRWTRIETRSHVDAECLSSRLAFEDVDAAVTAANIRGVRRVFEGESLPAVDGDPELLNWYWLGTCGSVLIEGTLSGGVVTDRGLRGRMVFDVRFESDMSAAINERKILHYLGVIRHLARSNAVPALLVSVTQLVDILPGPTGKIPLSGAPDALKRLGTRARAVSKLLKSSGSVLDTGPIPDEAKQ